jgi:hypothetical protein
MLGAFDASHGRGYKQENKNSADDFKRQHWLILSWSGKQTPCSRLRSMAARGIGAMGLAR